jgi:hypothetical protein
VESGPSATPEPEDQTAINMVKARLAGFEKLIRMVTEKQDGASQDGLPPAQARGNPSPFYNLPPLSHAAPRR